MGDVDGIDDADDGDNDNVENLTDEEEKEVEDKDVEVYEDGVRDKDEAGQKVMDFSSYSFVFWH